MSLFHSILLGLIQGVAEFLPISSSGHLAIAEQLLGVEGASEIPGFFDVLLHLGTLVAVFVAYWPEIRDMILEFFQGIGDLIHGTTPTPVPPARRMILLVIVGTLPLFVILPFKDWIEGLSSNLYVVGLALLATGCLLFASDRVRKGRKTERSTRMTDALLVGAAQALATCPGLSRSGCTISAGMAMGFQRKFAVRYSFLLSLPAVFGATLLKVIKTIKAAEPLAEGILPKYLLGMAVAGVVGYFSIRLVDLLASKGKFGAFAWYCWGAGLLFLVLSLVGWTL